MAIYSSIAIPREKTWYGYNFIWREKTGEKIDRFNEFRSAINERLHIIQCAKNNVSKEEFLEAFNIVLIVGGSITIPHIRRAFETLEELELDGELERAVANS